MSEGARIPLLGQPFLGTVVSGTKIDREIAPIVDHIDSAQRDAPQDAPVVEAPQRDLGDFKTQLVERFSTDNRVDFNDIDNMITKHKNMFEIRFTVGTRDFVIVVSNSEDSIVIEGLNRGQAVPWKVFRSSVNGKGSAVSASLAINEIEAQVERAIPTQSTIGTIASFFRRDTRFINRMTRTQRKRGELLILFTDRGRLAVFVPSDQSYIDAMTFIHGESNSNWRVRKMTGKTRLFDTIQLIESKIGGLFFEKRPVATLMNAFMIALEGENFDWRVVGTEIIFNIDNQYSIVIPSFNPEGQYRLGEDYIASGTIKFLDRNGSTLASLVLNPEDFNQIQSRVVTPANPFSRSTDTRTPKAADKFQAFLERLSD